MRILFPSDYFKPKMPDETFLDQVIAFKHCGLDVATINLDGLSSESKILPSPQLENVLYRGWMLEAKEYECLCQAIHKNGATPFTNLNEYLAAHYLPNWYSKIKEFTPETVILEIDCDLTAELKKIGWQKYFIKDYVKSLKTSVGAIIDSAEQADTVVREMKKFRGKIEGGLCVRQVENFVPNTEKRYFVLNGQPYSAIKSDRIPWVVEECASRVKSKFFSIDVIENANGIQRVVEIGDGQVSDIVGWSSNQLAGILKLGKMQNQR